MLFIYFFSLFKKFFEIYLIHNVMLVSSVHLSDSAMHSLFAFSSIIGYYKMLNIVPCAIYTVGPCCYLFYI